MTPKSQGLTEQRFVLLVLNISYELAVTLSHEFFWDMLV